MKKYTLLFIILISLTSFCFAKGELKVPILMLHSFTDKIENTNYTTITKDKFREVIGVLKAHGYENISFEELSKYVKGEIELNEKVYLIAIDDGYKNNYTYIYPILKENNISALISIVGWSVGRETMLDDITPIIPHFNWNELNEMLASGVVEVGNHTFDMHKCNEYDSNERKGVLQKENESDNLYAHRFKRDINKLSELILENCGIKEKVFCYPYGFYNDNTEKMLDEMGYEITLTTDEGVNYLTQGASLKKLKRINISMYTDIERIIKQW